MMHREPTRRAHRTGNLGPRPLLPTAAIAAAAALAGGCGDGPTEPEVARFSEAITFGELQDRVAQAAAQNRPSRIEVEVRPGSDVAEEVELEEEEKAGDEEELEGRAAGFVDATCPAGSLRLALGAFEVVVAFDGATEFEAETSASEEITCQEFVDRIQQALAEGRTPRVEAERPPRDPPQGPEDPTFVASALEIEDDEDEDEDEIEINIDADNLGGSADGTLGTIRVLGLEFRVTAATEVEAELDVDRVEFEGAVACASIDLGENAFSLDDGTVVRIVAETEVEVDLNGGDVAGSLEDVRAACDAGLAVEAEGEGVVVGEDPLTLEATEVEFEVEDEAGDGD